MLLGAPHRNHAGVISGPHTCQETLKIFLSVNRNPTGNELRRRLATALAAHLTCLTGSREVNIMERSLDILLSCTACLGELCMITASKSQDLTEYVLCKPRVPYELCSVVFTSALEAMLCRATAAGLQGCCGNVGCAADFPCVKLGLCDCAMRPLYVAIYFSNEQMVSTLLRYGADVVPEDTCDCVASTRLHPLLRVYKILSDAYWPSTGVPDRHVNSSASMDIVRCHQLAALVMPCRDAQLRETCYAFAKAFTPPDEYKNLLHEKGSLRHLSRLAIRAALAKRLAMPKGVEKLPLPKLLQRYILYQYGPGCV